VRLLLVARYVSERGSLDTIRIPEVAARRGHSIDVLRSDEANLASIQDVVQRYDAVICRFSSDPVASMLTRALLNVGVPIIGGDNGLTTGDDQTVTLEALRIAGIPTPEFAVVTSPGEADHAANAMGWPVVTKDPLTMGGSGVRLSADMDAIRLHLSELDEPPRLIVQRFYPEAAGEDHRLFVVGSHLVGSIRRVAQQGEFRANLFLGGMAIPYRATQEEADFAIAAAEAIGLDVAGVDLLDTDDGPLVMEVNHNPGATGIDLAADAIVTWAERRSGLTAI
jgi:ribosomal protein S6--L-glutamate ligase